MGLNEGGNSNILRVSLGAVRKPCAPTAAKAKRRETKEGKEVWEQVWNSVTGKFIGFTLHTHPEYGNSWNVHLEDGEVFVIQITENSVYGTDLLKKIPNMKIGKVYTLNPYDFVPSGEEKRRTGLSIKHEAEDGSSVRVDSYYQKFRDKPGGGVEVENINGYPDFDGNPDDREDWKIYYLTVTKIMRKKAMEYIVDPSSTGRQHVEEPPPQHTPPSPHLPIEDDGLPF